MENQIKAQNPSFNILLFSWVIFVALYAFLNRYSPFHNTAGILLAIGVVGSNAIAFIYSSIIWKKVAGKSKLIFGFFSLSLLCILISNVIYQGIYNAFKLTYPTQPSFATFHDAIYFGYLIFQSLAWMLIFLKIVSSAKRHKDLALYIPLVIILLFTLLMLIIVFKLEITRYQISSISTYNIVYAILGFSGFILAMLCLACAKHKGLFYLALGFLISKSGGLIMIFGTFAQKFHTGSVAETLWILSHFVMAYGFINFIRTESYNTDPKTWVHPINSLRTQISFWVFTIFIFSAFICAAVYYLTTGRFFLQSTNDLQALFPALCLYSIITVILSKIFTDRISIPLAKIEHLIDLFMQSKEPDQPLQDKYYNMLEFNNVEDFLKSSFSVLKEKNQAKGDLSKCAAQVSHDIRSPLAALETVLQDLPELTEQKRILIRNATQQIGDIANNLLLKYRKEPELTEILRPELVSCLLDSLISEKRVQLAGKPIDISLEIDSAAQGAFATLNANTFKRVISNLINNAAEAIESAGVIRILAQKEENNLVIKIIDNGKGIPADLLPEIQKGGVSFGKIGGSGLGIAGAIQHIKKWHGSYTLDSKHGEGTIFTLNLPTTNEPEWFQSDIKLAPKMHISVLDDDESIHNVWNMHFQDYLQNKQIALTHFYNPADFIKHCESSSQKQELFLVDYELIGFNKTGMDLIKSLNLKDRAILVTSRYNETEVMKQAKALGVKIIPKNFAPYIPISRA